MACLIKLFLGTDLIKTSFSFYPSLRKIIHLFLLTFILYIVICDKNNYLLKYYNFQYFYWIKCATHNSVNMNGKAPMDFYLDNQQQTVKSEEVWGSLKKYKICSRKYDRMG